MLLAFHSLLSTTQQCDRKVAEAEWKDLFPFLDLGIQSRFAEVCSKEFPEGSYTGMLAPNGTRDGWGEIRWRNGTLYGPGNIFFYTTGDRYLGQWTNNLQQGVGTLYSQTGVYVGDWKAGVQQGNGTAMYNNGNEYTGQFKNGLKEGYGVFSVINGDVYKGNFKAGMRDGQGIETFYTGEKYIGSYSKDRRHGQGTAYYSSGGVKYVGEWAEGSPHGNGTYVALNGDMYIGLFSKGVLTGPGRIVETNGAVREVESQDDISFRTDSSRILDTIWAMVEYIGLGPFFQKYIDFFTSLAWPGLLG